jgi:hypothetical protein
VGPTSVTQSLITNSELGIPQRCQSISRYSGLAYHPISKYPESTSKHLPQPNEFVSQSIPVGTVRYQYPFTVVTHIHIHHLDE